MTTKLFLKMYSRTAVRLCYSCCLLLLFAACSKDNYPQDSDTPPHAASDKTWVIEIADGSIKQTWSDAIQIPECNKEDFDGGKRDALKADCRSYRHEGYTYYYYSWPYVDAYKSSLCPSPWRVPSQRDFDDLDWAFVVASKSIAVDKSVPALYQTEWGPVYGGYAVGNGGNGIGECCTWARYWSTTESTDEVGSALVISNVGYHASGHTNSKTVGYQVRCVK